jgi:HAD superfamily hydrolase (TIGR01509 family)
VKNIKEFSALILDCDGVIVDSESMSCGAWNLVFKREYNIEIGNNYNEILGTNTIYAAQYYLRKFNIEYSDSLLNRICTLKEEAYLELATGNLRPINGIEKVIQEAKSLDWKVAVASSGIQSKIRFSLRQVKLDDQFDAIVGFQDGVRGKPFPDIFLEAARQINVTPEYCIVIEDTPNGILAANRAGMYVIGITTTYSRNKLKRASLVISSFSELNLKSL